MPDKHYILYIDDSGSRFPDIKDNNVRDDGMDCFALGGILVESNHKEEIKNKYLEFCKKWNINTPLHSNEIRGRREGFAWLKTEPDKEAPFLKDLEEFLLSIPVLGFAAVVSRPGYNQRYKEKYGDKRWQMCKTSYFILIERVVKYVVSKGGSLEIRFEEVGKSEDRAIIDYTKKIKEEGLPFDADKSAKYCGLKNECFKNTIKGDAERKKKGNLYVQIADLYLYPMVKRIYNPNYRPWVVLHGKNKIIDSLIKEEDKDILGIKYSCFESFR